jgi:predicted RNA-binding Zn-ribbon protein involved in translation (DUF1610 family)
MIRYTFDECPNCLKKGLSQEESHKIIEIYLGQVPTEFQPIEKYIYFCPHCGWVIKRLRYLRDRKSDEYFKIEFINDEMRVTEWENPYV